MEINYDFNISKWNDIRKWMVWGLECFEFRVNSQFFGQTQIATGSEVFMWVKSTQGTYLFTFSIHWSQHGVCKMFFESYHMKPDWDIHSLATVGCLRLGIQCSTVTCNSLGASGERDSPWIMMIPNGIIYGLCWFINYDDSLWYIMVHEFIMNNHNPQLFTMIMR